jgi:DNA-binding NarL/FixJ family response regulator
LGAIATQRDVMEAPRWPATEAAYQRLLAAVRSTLEQSAFDTAWESGAALPLDGAIAEATRTLREIAVAPPAPAPVPAVAGLTGAVGSDLTPREREVLRLLVEGRTDREIAAALFVTPKTASNHVANILAKLGVETRTAAAAFALRHGLA